MSSQATTDDATFTVEERGIDLVPAGAHHGQPIELLWMWLGANMSVFYIVAGALVIGTGLSFAQAVLAIVLGNLCWFLLGLNSLQGPATGTATHAVSRAAYGPRGGQGLSFFNWLTCIGFEASGISTAVLAAVALLQKAGIGPSTGVRTGVIVVATGAMVIIPLYGHATIVFVQRWVAQIAIPLLSIMAIMILTKVHLGAVSRGGSWSAIMVSIALIMSGGGLSANCGSDYSRYLPENTSKRAIFWYSSLGGMIPSLLLSLLGAALASVIKNGSDPIAGIPLALPTFVVVPYLLFVVLSTLTGVSWDLYSSGLSLQALGVQLRRWQCVILDAVICSRLTFIVVFSSQFSHYYSDFLSLLGVWLAPWAAIYLRDWVLRKGQYDAPSLLSRQHSIYWRGTGWHRPAVAAQLLGMVAAVLWINSPAFVGPLSSRTAHSDFSIFFGVAVAGLVYWMTARRSVPTEAGRAPKRVPLADLAFASPLGRNHR